MNILSYAVFTIVSLYSALGLFFLRQACRPSCRVCLHRHSCPNRLRGPSRLAEIPICFRRGPAKPSDESIGIVRIS